MDFNFAIVLNPVGPFGGAQRRFTNLFRYLHEKYPANAYFFVSYDLYERIKNIYPDYPVQNVIPIGRKKFHKNNKTNSKNLSKSNHDVSLLRKLYKYLKSYKDQYSLHREIEKYRRENKIDVFIGVFSGVLPLYFYLQKKKRKVAVIFSDMDSWFFDIITNPEEYWYRKFSAFNYALENADIVDFLSPFILEGVRERGIKIPKDKISIAPCSFADYSKCKIGDKSKFLVVFSGRLEKDKNPLMFIDAAKILSEKYSDIIFHIMGEGRLSSRVMEDVKGFSNIIYHGFHPSPTDILADSSVFVSLQPTNNYPSQSILEAMACGNAITATDVGDTRMFINEKNGSLIKLNLEELVHAIEYLYLNRNVTKKLGDYAYSYVRERHTIKKSADYYLNLFEKAFQKNNIK